VLKADLCDPDIAGITVSADWPSKNGTSKMPSDSFVGKLEPDGVSFPFIMSTPVWGAGHLGLFLNVCLPSLLAAGNLPSFAPHPQNRYLIYTRSEDELELKAAPTFQLLSEIIAVEVRLIEEEITEPHRTMSNCHIDSIRRADEVGGAAIFLPPDCVWSENSMVALERIARSGKSVVHMSGIRLDRDGVIPEFASRYSNDGTVLSLRPRELVSIGMRHLHPIALTHFWKDYNGQLMPANLIWNVPSEGLLLRCFHLHPLMVKSQVPFAKFSSTIDDDLALRACPDASRDYVVTDSDEILAFEMSGLSRVVGTICPKESPEGVAAWAEFGANARHRELVKNTIRLKSADDSGAAWSVAQAESDDVVNSVAKMNACSTAQLFYRFPSVFAGRAMAAAFGRGDHSDDATLVVIRYLVRLVVLLVRLNAALRRKIFLVDGVPRITHPFWLIRRRLVAALQKIILLGDREVVLVGADPQIAAQVKTVHPNSIIHTFAPGSGPAPIQIGGADFDEVDTLVVIDVDSLDAGPLVQQHLGRRQILLRLSGDSRPVCGHFDEIRFFGGRGTRLSSLFWNGVRRFRARVRPLSHIANSVTKAVGAPLRPLFYVGLALTSCSVNVLGLVLDVAKDERRNAFQKEGNSMPHEPTT
jgi:hypothetical protein